MGNDDVETAIRKVVGVSRGLVPTAITGTGQGLLHDFYKEDVLNFFMEQKCSVYACFLSQRFDPEDLSLAGVSTARVRTLRVPFSDVQNSLCKGIPPLKVPK